MHLDIYKRTTKSASDALIGFLQGRTPRTTELLIKYKFIENWYKDKEIICRKNSSLTL